MYFSQDSDIDLQWQKTIKPRNFSPKFNNFCEINDVFLTTVSDRFHHDEDRPQCNITRTESICEDKISSGSTENLQGRKPIFFDPRIKPTETEKNREDDSQQKNKQKHMLCTDFISHTKKNTKNQLKIKIFEEDSEKEQEGNQQFYQTQRTQKVQRMIRSCQNSKKYNQFARIIQENNQFQEQTTPIFSNTPNKSNIVKEYIKNGNRIRTCFQKGLINGYTEIDYIDHGKLRGIFNEGDLVSGELAFPNKFVYSGEFSNFTFHGFGKLKFPTGQIFQGNWVAGCLDRKGKIIYPKGQIYCGEIIDFRRNGEGQLYFGNGCKYVGEFANGEITGCGQLHKNGVLTHKGFWLNGKFYGNDYDAYQEQKRLFDRTEKIKRNKRDKKKSDIIRSSIKKIYNFHASLNY